MKTSTKECKSCGHNFEGTADDRRCLECDEAIAAKAQREAKASDAR